MLEVHVLYRQWRRSGWFRRFRWGTKEVVAVYADWDKVREFVEDNQVPICRYTVETLPLVYGHVLREKVVLEILSDYGKRLLGLCE